MENYTPPPLQSSLSEPTLDRSIYGALRRQPSLTKVTASTPSAMADDRAPWRLKKSRSALSIEDTTKKVARGARIALIGGDSRAERAAACEEAAALTQGFCLQWHQCLLDCIDNCKAMCHLESTPSEQESDSYLLTRLARWLSTYNRDFLLQSFRRRLSAHTPKDAIFVPDAESAEQLDFLVQCGFTIVTLSKHTGATQYKGPLASFESKEDFFDCVKGT